MVVWITVDELDCSFYSRCILYMVIVHCV